MIFGIGKHRVSEHEAKEEIEYSGCDEQVFVRPIDWSDMIQIGGRNKPDEARVAHVRGQKHLDRLFHVVHKDTESLRFYRRLVWTGFELFSGKGALFEIILDDDDLGLFCFRDIFFLVGCFFAIVWSVDLPFGFIFNFFVHGNAGYESDVETEL